MTTKKELLAKIAELQAKVDEMADEFKIETVRAYGPLPSREIYYVADAEGDVTTSAWDNDKIDKDRLNCGQVFLTEEAAEREAKRKHLWHQCRKAMRDAWEDHGKMPNWADDTQEKYSVYIKGDKVKDGAFCEIYERIHFPTEESLRVWRSTVTNDDIKLMLIEEW